MKFEFLGKSTAVFLTACLLLPAAYAANSRDAIIDAKVKVGENVSAVQGKTTSDGSGYVYKVQGKARLAHAGSPVESRVKTGDKIVAGDSITTEKGASVSVTFDFLKKNAVHIPESSHAIFNSIEPTDIKLENGTVFSAVDGLAAGSTWKVSTPAAVAAVRGTVYLVRFETASGEFYAATVDVPDDGKSSAIDIQLLDNDGSANIPEGKEITLKEGEAPSQDKVQDLNPETVAEIQKFFEQLKDERQEVEEDAEKQADEMSQGDSSSDSGSNMNMEDEKEFDSTEPSTTDNLPNLDPGEDFKEELGQKELEQEFEEDFKYKTNASYS